MSVVQGRAALVGGGAVAVLAILYSAHALAQTGWLGGSQSSLATLSIAGVAFWSLLAVLLATAVAVAVERIIAPYRAQIASARDQLASMSSTCSTQDEQLAQLADRERSAAALRAKLREAAHEAAVASAKLTAQHSLERNMAILQRLIAGEGDVRVDGEELFFGDHLVNGDTVIVDRVHAEAGGTATIFLRDRRVSTNVRTPTGERAVGTRLTNASVRQTVLEEAKSYHGEAEILGQHYAAIYEPLVSEGAIVGIFMSACRTSGFLVRSTTPTPSIP